jgi:uncharacterized Zn finger protein (UPF0148 family)
MKEQACPNCGAASPKVIAEGEYRCTFCDTLYIDKALIEKRRAAEKKMAYSKAKESQYNAQAAQAVTVNKMSKRIIMVVVIGLIIVFAYVGFMAYNSMQQQQKMQEEMMKEMKESLPKNH